MKLYRKWIINEVARAGEHTNERTYVRTYSHTYVRDRSYIPSTTLLCEGIMSQQHFMKMFLQQNNHNLPTRLIGHNGKQWPTTSTCDITLWLSRTTDNSNFFIGSREVRDNERRLYFKWPFYSSRNNCAK